MVFITGGASGIGADMVRAFAANRCKLAFVDIQTEVGNALADELRAGGTEVLFTPCDITDIGALKAAIDATHATLGPIRVLVNNAANDDRHKFDDVTVEYWDNTIDINLRPHFFAAQAVRPQMRDAGGGAVINFSSISWRGGSNGMMVYATAKAAILGLTRALAREFGGDNIHVNSIEPGAVITERQKQLWYPTQESIDNIVNRQMIRRVLLGDEIARLALFLASDDSRMITRQSIICDGGLA
ncbi:MAG: 3-oxoacyl-ACP reductase [Devosia sp.]|nr:3-oxoacyl-ACP reductase [Devosia sp.]